MHCKRHVCVTTTGINVHKKRVVIHVFRFKKTVNFLCHTQFSKRTQKKPGTIDIEGSSARKKNNVSQLPCQWQNVSPEFPGLKSMHGRCKLMHHRHFLQLRQLNLICCMGNHHAKSQCQRPVDGDSEDTQVLGPLGS